MATWLKEHPGIEVICRDRAESYADGARRGAPKVRQVADRFHLVQNLVNVLQKVFNKHQDKFTSEEAIEESVLPFDVPEPQIIELQETLPLTTQGKRRYENYQQARALYKKGWTLKAIGEHLGIKRHTVRNYVDASSFPDRRQGSKLDAYKPYMLKRWNEGCKTGTVIFDEIKALGYKGKRSSALYHPAKDAEATDVWQSRVRFAGKTNAVSTSLVTKRGQEPRWTGIRT